MIPAKSTPKVRSSPQGPKPPPQPKPAAGPKPANKPTAKPANKPTAKPANKPTAKPANATKPGNGPKVNALKSKPGTTGKEHASKVGARKSSGSSGKSVESLEPTSQEVRLRRDVMRGKMDVDCPTNAKVVRIFTSSTFTDSFHERNALMARVYPELKSFCQEAGYEFQVVDMRWGVRDEATDNHMTTELCLREVKICQKLSTGPNFVTFLSHKYGNRTFPSRIESKEFESMFNTLEDGPDKELVSKWFKKDDNSVPPCYILLPISTYLPGFVSDDQDKRKEAKEQWNEESGIVKGTLVKAAEQVLSAEGRNKYIISVTEAEIEAGILSKENVNNHCVWFRRVIADIEGKERTDLLANFIDFSSSETEQEQKRSLLKELAESKLPSILDDKQIHRHEINWSDDGINPEVNEEHQKYIEDMCVDFETTIRDMITRGIEERNKHAVNDDLYEEVLQHTLFAQTKCRSFHGREDMLETIKDYIVGKSRAPLVVYGQSGSGKTSVVAKAAMLTKSWLESDQKSVVILRFLGTTPDSTGIISLLTSVIKQIMALTPIDQVIPTGMKELVELFQKMLGIWPGRTNLVLFLDSLDQLDPSHSARQLSWLPKHLSPLVKIVVSTLPEPIYECFPRLQTIVKNQNQFLEVPTLPDKDVSNILDSWLSIENRTLTAAQAAAVLTAFKQCPIPLFLKLSFDEACKWKSYELPEDGVLQDTVRAAINSLFDRVERLHGKLLVSRAIALLTLSLSGLTESELEDILSCDEEVLNDVYQYWLPSVRRLPPLLLVRMKADLDEYLVDRGADGVRVFNWYHRQFVETAKSRYCTDEATNTKVHTQLADFFRGTWNGVLKPYTDKSGNSGEAERFVPAQPLRFGATHNLRKLKNLPYHLIHGNMLSVLKEDVCLNMEFLLAKLKAVSSRSVLDDFEEAYKTFPEDEETQLILEALRLSQDALLYDPNELPTQLLGRIPAEKEHIFGDLTTFSTQYVLPNVKILTPPGGQLIHCLAGHREFVNCVDITSDGNIAVTASADKSVRFWDVKAGKLIQSIEDVGEDPEKILISAGNTVAVVNAAKHVIGLRVPSGDTAYKIDNVSDRSSSNIAVCGKNKSTLVLLREKFAYIFDASTGNMRSKVANLSEMTDDFSQYDPTAARGRYVASATSGSAILRILDVEKQEFIHNKRMFPAPKSDDDDDLSIDGLAISPDKKTLLFSNYMDNDIHICHLKTMARLRVLKGKRSDNSEKFHISLDGSVLYFPNYLSMCFVDLKTGIRINHIKHPNNISDVTTVDMTHFVSVSSDSVVRIWDLSREDPRAKQNHVTRPASQGRSKSARKRQTPVDVSNDNTDAEPEEKFSFRTIEALPNPRYVFISNRRGEIQIYDIVKKLTVRSANVNADKNVKWHVVDEKTAIAITDDRRLHLVDLDKMAPVKVIQGYLPKYNSDIVCRKTAREIITLTRGRKNLKIHNMDTGLTVHILNTGQTKLIDDILVSKDERWLVAGTDEGPVILFNLETRTLQCYLKEDDVGEYPIMSDSMFTPCGTYLLLNCSRKYPTEPGIEEYYFLVINPETGTIVHHMLDVEYVKKYKKAEVDYSADVGCSVYLRDFLFLVGSDDRLIRVWDINNGELLHRLPGHSRDVSTLAASADGARFLSYSSYTEEEAFRLWDGHTFTCLATFKADDDMNRICITTDGSRVVAGNVEKKTLVVWKLTGAGTEAEEVKGEEDFEGEQTALTFTPLGPVSFDVADPDIEDEEVSDDDDPSEGDEDEKKEVGPIDFDLSDDDFDTDKELSDLKLSDSEEELSGDKTK